MSAQMTQEIRTGERAVAYYDRIGYGFCTVCAVEKPGLTTGTPDGTCDECGRDLRRSVELFDGWATIEYPRCKIF